MAEPITRADRNMMDLLSQENLPNPQSTSNQSLNYNNFAQPFATNQQANQRQFIANQIPNTSNTSQLNKVGASATGPINQNQFPPASSSANVLPSPPAANYGNTIQSPFYPMRTNNLTPAPLQYSTVNQGYPRTVTQIAQSRLMDAIPQPPPPRVISPSTSKPLQTSFPQKLQSTSRIEYVPYNKKIVEYHDQQKVTVVPKTRKVVEYRQQKIIDVIPKQAVKQDYYAVERIKQYIPQYVPETLVTMVQRAVPFKRIQYVPVTRQVYHGAPLGNEGVQSVPYCSGISPMMSQLSGGVGSYMPWQNNASIQNTANTSHIYGTSLYQNQLGMSSASYMNCDRFRRNLNNIYDSYEAYVPSFKY